MPDWTRRDFLASTAAGSGLAALTGRRQGSAANQSGAADAPMLSPNHEFDITLVVNGASHRVKVDARTTLLDALRERLHLTGTKKGCALGQCGACTVLLEGRRINSCLTLAVMQQEKSITTIEGLANGNGLHPVQAAFVEHDGFQCGYCTPGQIMSAVGLLAEHRPTDDSSVREWMSGNICRCGAYANIAVAVQSVSGGAV